MNMNKNKIILVCNVIIILLSFFVLNINVYADSCDSYGCATCSYKINDYLVSFDLKSNGDCNVDVTFSHKYIGQNNSNRGVTVDFKNSLVSSNFISKDTNKLVCPSKLFYFATAGGTKISYDISATKKDTGSKMTSYQDLLIDSSSTNNNLKIGESCNILSCSKEVVVGSSSNKIKVTAQLVNGEIKYSFNKPNVTVKSSLVPSDFASGCPKYYVKCGGSGDNLVCSLSMTNDFDVRNYEASASNEDTEVGECGIGYVKNSKTNECDTCASGFYKNGLYCVKECPSNYSAEDGVCKENTSFVAEDPCNEGSIKQVLRFFGYLLLIAKVVIPLLIIGFGTFDLFKAVTDKDEKSLGKQLKVLGIRIFVGLFVFFIPNLVYSVFGLTERLNFIQKDKYRTCADCLLKPNLCDIKTDTSK